MLWTCRSANSRGHGLEIATHLTTAPRRHTSMWSSKCQPAELGTCRAVSSPACQIEVAATSQHEILHKKKGKQVWLPAPFEHR